MPKKLDNAEAKQAALGLKCLLAIGAKINELQALLKPYQLLRRPLMAGEAFGDRLNNELRLRHSNQLRNQNRLSADRIGQLQHQASILKGAIRLSQSQLCRCAQFQQQAKLFEDRKMRQEYGCGVLCVVLQIEARVRPPAGLAQFVNNRVAFG